MNLQHLYTKGLILLALSWGYSAQADSAIRCVRHSTPKTHLGQRYNVSCHYNLAEPLESFAETLTYTWVGYSGHVYNLPYESPLLDESFAFVNARIKIVNPNCAVRVSNMGGNIAIADCPSGIQSVSVKIVANILEIIRYPGPYRATWFNGALSDETFVVATGGNGGNSGSGSNQNADNLYWGLRKCKRACEDTNRGVCRRVPERRHRYSCEAN